MYKRLGYLGAAGSFFLQVQHHGRWAVVACFRVFLSDGRITRPGVDRGFRR